MGSTIWVAEVVAEGVDLGRGYIVFECVRRHVLLMASFCTTAIRYMTHVLLQLRKINGLLHSICTHASLGNR